MERIKKIVLLSIAILLSSPVVILAKGVANNKLSIHFDWNPVIDAIIYVESRGDAHAKSGSSIGAMQITPILVAECNQILEKRKSKKRFKLSDRFSIAKSKEMFLLIQSRHNPKNNVEKAIRSWNGGLNYSVKRTQRYFRKVMAAMK